MSRQSSVSLASLAVLGALTLSGCAASAEAVPAESTATAASAGSTTDAVTCTGFNDVLTIIVNADAGLRDGRMAEQEQQGWYRLATRVLDGVPTRGEGAVSDATATLKGLAPMVRLGATGTTDIGSIEWSTGLDVLSTACSQAGAEMSAEKFTGG